MNQRVMYQASAITALFMVAFGPAFSPGARAAVLEDFGYQNMKVQGSLAIGARPTLIILLDLTNSGAFYHSAAYYDNLVCNPFNTNAAGVRSVNGYMMVNSHARFSLTRAGTGLIGPLQLPADELTKALTNDTMKAGFTIKAAAGTGFNFAQFDSNGNGQITTDELLVLVFENHKQKDDGAARWANPDGTGGGFQPAGSPVSFALSVGFMSQRVSFATLCHEMSHLLDTKDLYGIWNVTCHSLKYTLMSCTITFSDNMAIYGLDAWHKMQLGWVEPRIRSLAAGGVETVTAAQAPSITHAPIILYDPAHGTREFFLIEYRTRTSPWGTGYEDDLPSNGLGIWHVVHDANKGKIFWESVGESIFLEGPPDLRRAHNNTNMLWAANTTTPLLRWTDGTNTTSTATRIKVRDFNPGDGSITFEWLTPSDTWVDFQHNGTEAGTFAQPFNSLGEGVNAASHGGTVKFKLGGSTPETASISKALVLSAEGGPVTIGQ